jgi:hypothetical protein
MIKANLVFSGHFYKSRPLSLIHDALFGSGGLARLMIENIITFEVCCGEVGRFNTSTSKE